MVLCFHQLLLRCLHLQEASQLPFHSYTFLRLVYIRFLHSPFNCLLYYAFIIYAFFAYLLSVSLSKFYEMNEVVCFVVCSMPNSYNSVSHIVGAQWLFVGCYMND